MANALYDKGREGFLDGSIDWDTDNIKAVLVDDDQGAGYVPDLGTDEFLSVIPADCRIATSANFTAKTVAAGVADAADITFSAVAAGYVCEYVAIFKDTGDPATSRLIALIDTATGLPVTTNGNDVNVTWDNGPNKIFKL